MKLVPSLDDCSRIMLALIFLRALNLVRLRYLAALAEHASFKRALREGRFLQDLRRSLCWAAGTLAVLLPAFAFHRSPEWWEFGSLLTDGIRPAHALAAAGALLVFEHQLEGRCLPIARLIYDTIIRLAKRLWIAFAVAVFAMNRAIGTFLDWAFVALGVLVLIVALLPTARLVLQDFAKRLAGFVRNAATASLNGESTHPARVHHPSCTSRSSHIKTSSSRWPR